MRKIVVVSDSFKGSLSSLDISKIALESVPRFFPECKVISFPVADGGEGTVDSVLEMRKDERVLVEVTGPWNEKVSAAYARIGHAAVIEMAAAAGLPMVEERLDPSGTTTYGVGELIKHAVINGAKDLILGLGGSCTNDAGCGCAAALGVKFLDEEKNEFIPTGRSLSKIVGYDTSAADKLLEDVKITAMCDVDNPLFGENGASYIFAPQKGADAEMVGLLDAQLRYIAELVKKKLNRDVADLPGAGAAGGLGFGVMAFMKGELRSGINVILDLADFDNVISDCDLVITGEGRLDSQSFRGKVISGIAKRTSAKNVPLVAIVGDVQDDAYEAYDIGVTAIFSINRRAIPFSEAVQRSRQNYIRTFEDVLRFVVAMENHQQN